MTYMRARNGTVEAAVVTLRHPTGPTVTLFGVAHIGRPDYYEQILDDVRTLAGQGAAVGFEGVRKPTEEKLADATGEERARWEQIRRTGVGDYRTAAALLGLTAQDVRSYPPDWVNVDLDGLDVARHFLRERRNWILDATDPLDGVPARALWFAVYWTMKHHRVVNTLLLARPGTRSFRRFAVGERNRLVMEFVDRTVFPVAGERGGDVALIYGADHLPGIVGGLKRRGFGETGRRWLTVMSGPARIADAVLSEEGNGETES